MIMSHKLKLCPFLLQIALFVSSNDAVQPGWLVNFLMNVDSKQIIEMQNNLAKVLFRFHGTFISYSFYLEPTQRQSTERTETSLLYTFMCHCVDICSIQGISYSRVQLSLSAPRT